LNRIQNNVSNNNSFEKENGGRGESNGMILGGLKEKLQNKNEFKPDLPQFPMKYKK
jgi:hypothetical protein